MGTVFCDNCGVSLLEETAKFCRACGKPTPLSEAATKRFDEQPGFQTATRSMGPSPTTPAYMAPFEFPPAPQTIDLDRKRKRNIILVATMLAMMIFALGGLLLFLNFESDPTPDIPVVTIPNAPRAPMQPPIPPVPPAPPVIGRQSKIDPSLIYPGSRETMSLTAEGGKDVLKLHTDDSAKKVVDWYQARLKGNKKITIVGQTILQAGETTVVVIDAEGTEILITSGGEDSEK